TARDADEQVRDRLPFDVFDRVHLTVAVAPTFARLDEARINRLAQGAQSVREGERHDRRGRLYCLVLFGGDEIQILGQTCRRGCLFLSHLCLLLCVCLFRERGDRRLFTDDRLGLLHDFLRLVLLPCETRGCGRLRLARRALLGCGCVGVGRSLRRALLHRRARGDVRRRLLRLCSFRRLRGQC